MLFGVVLYYGAGRISNRIIAGAPATSLRTSTDFAALEEIAIAVLGIFVLVDGLAEGVFYWAENDLYYRYLAHGLAIATPPIPPSEFAGVSAAATRIVLGLALFFLSRGISALRRSLLAARPM